MIFLVAGPLFWGSNGPNLSKRGLAASILDFHGPTFHFLAAGPNMLSAELESRPCSGKLACFLSWLASLCPPKTGPAQPDFRLLLGPFMCRQRSGSSKKGSCDLASTCFRTHLFRVFSTCCFEKMVSISMQYFLLIVQGSSTYAVLSVIQL
jgi:hypothetical protein